MELVKQSDNRFIFKGDITYWKDDSKKVVVDGETYVKMGRKEVIETVADMRGRSDIYFFDYEYNFVAINKDLFIEEYSGFTWSNLSEKIEQYSKNGYANAIYCAFKSGLLGKEIKDIFTCVRNYGINDWDSILRNSKVYIMLEPYGWNNAIYYALSTYTVFKMDFNSIPRDIIELFKNNGIDLSKKDRISESIKLLNKRINLKITKNN